MFQVITETRCNVFRKTKVTLFLSSLSHSLYNMFVKVKTKMKPRGAVVTDIIVVPCRSRALAGAPTRRRRALSPRAAFSPRGVPRATARLLQPPRAIDPRSCLTPQCSVSRTERFDLLYVCLEDLLINK